MICLIFGSDMKMRDFLNKNKKGITFGIVTVIVLAAAFFIGGNGNKGNDIPVTPPENISQASELSYVENTVMSAGNTESSNSSDDKSIKPEQKASVNSEIPHEEKSDILPEKSAASTKNESSEDKKSPVLDEPSVSQNDNTETEVSENTIQSAGSSSDGDTSPTVVQKPDTQTVKPHTQNDYPNKNPVEPNTNTGKTDNTQNEGNSVQDKIQTESSASEISGTESAKPDISVQENEDNKNYCTFDIVCTTAVNSSELDERKRKLLPSDGCIIKEAEVSFDEGETAFDVLKRVCTENNIQLEFSITPLTGAAYIEGINNLYEFDCGSLSGWMYSVNDEFSNVGCSEYKLSDGDKIKFLYTCDLGADIGNYYRG